MKGLGIIFAGVVATAILFAFAVMCGNIVYRVLCAVYNKIKENNGIRETL